MLKLKVTKVGNSKALILNKEAVARLRVEEGDMLCLTEVPGGYRLTPDDPEFERRMASARKMAKKWRPLLRELAK
jgi:putative addiction module antidote